MAGGQLTDLGDKAVDMLYRRGPRETAVAGVRNAAALSRSLANYARTQRLYDHARPGWREVCWVDPHDIELIHARSLAQELGRSLLVPQVVGGPWDRRPVSEATWLSGKQVAREGNLLLRLDNYVFQQSVDAHFREGVPWPETELYRRVAESDRLYDIGRRYRSVETMEPVLDALDRLYERIREEGYRSQAELGTGPLGRPEHHEITVTIGRDGTLFKSRAGRHRLAVAKALDLETVPVRVWLRHERWQAIRAEVAGAASFDDVSVPARRHLDHPDVAPLLSDGSESGSSDDCQKQ